MVVEIVNTGTELMLGRVLNTHQQWLCGQLADMGIVPSRQVAITDAGPAIQSAVRDALQHADLVITTGGLGPTSDDITRDLIAGLLGRKLMTDQTALSRIEHFFGIRKRRIPDNAKLQALVPEGAVVLQNEHGTAPGLAIKVSPNPFRENKQPSWLVMLPGPPRELRPMFTNQVRPLIRKEFLEQDYVCRILKTTGLGESFVEEKIAGPLQALVVQGLELGYCARVQEVEVRLAGRGGAAAKLVADSENIVREQIGPYIFGESNDSLEAVIVRLLTAKRQTLSLAESCTGGLIANRVTNVSGASAVLMAGLVTYSNESKQRLLGVRAETLEKYGAVSEQTAREMAEGAREKNGTDYALAVTGIAGPTGGTEEKPIGTVFVALATAEKTIVNKYFNPYDRETFKFATSQQALDLLRRTVAKLES